jgi:solute carrier family 25 citrate transporter 1
MELWGINLSIEHLSNAWLKCANQISTAGLAAGVTEAVAVVTPMEVIKIRLQAQHHSMADPLDIPKYRNAAHALYTVVMEEGIGALYRGISLTALRQGRSLQL